MLFGLRCLKFRFRFVAEAAQLQQSIYRGPRVWLGVRKEGTGQATCAKGESGVRDARIGLSMVFEPFLAAWMSKRV